MFVRSYFSYAILDLRAGMLLASQFTEIRTVHRQVLQPAVQFRVFTHTDHAHLQGQLEDEFETEGGGNRSPSIAARTSRTRQLEFELC